MKTNRFFLAILAVAGMMTACSNEGAVQQLNTDSRAISFRLQGGTPETVLRTNATTLEKLDAFVVYGTDDVFDAAGALIFDGVTVGRKVGAGNVFEYAPKRYFDEKATDSRFFAYSPVSANVTEAHTLGSFISAGVTLTYTVPDPDFSTNITQEDLLVAGAAVTAFAPVTNVHLEFKHALSRIFVTASNSAADPVIITRLTLKNLAKTGYLDVDLTNMPTWTSFTDIGDYEYILAESGGVAVLPGAGNMFVTSKEQGMMVLPQITINENDDNVFDTNDFALEVNYDFANLTGQTKYILLKEGYEFEAGKQYSININFSGREITFTVDVIDFDDIQEVYYPTNP